MCTIRSSRFGTESLSKLRKITHFTKKILSPANHELSILLWSRQGLRLARAAQLQTALVLWRTDFVRALVKWVAESWSWRQLKRTRWGPERHLGPVQRVECANVDFIQMFPHVPKSQFLSQIFCNPSAVVKELVMVASMCAKSSDKMMRKHIVVHVPIYSPTRRMHLLLLEKHWPPCSFKTASMFFQNSMDMSSLHIWIFEIGRFILNIIFHLYHVFLYINEY